MLSMVQGKVRYWSGKVQVTVRSQGLVLTFRFLGLVLMLRFMVDPELDNCILRLRLVDMKLVLSSIISPF